MSDSEHDPVVPTRGASHDDRPPRLSRRIFLKSSGAAVASAGAAAASSVAVFDGRSAMAQDATPAATPAGAPTGGMPGMGTEERPTAFFNLHEAETVDALVSRILPGSADDPGAREAGVVFYIDQALGGSNLGFTLKTYTQGPFSLISEEPVTVEASSSRDIYEFVNVAADQAARYGFQSVLTPQEIYRRGIAFVDAYAQSQFQNDFIALTTEQQDEILTAMDEDTVSGFEGPSGKAFFTQLRNHTIEGMFGDPMYGGNRDLAGWKLIGYPGAQRFYTPEDIKNPGFTRDPQSLAQLIAKEGH